ncbi:MAG: GNAT family N-acetyltransferase [Magnetospirillum sp.]|nr:GNAT family N-acetyltransferase [Magnetospirillum sp.]
MDIAVALSPCPDPLALSVIWRALEAEADGSVFLSWPWIGTMLARCEPPPLLVTAERRGVVVGLGLLGRRRGRNPLRTPSLHLNQTGNPVEDGVMIEYNGLLARRGDEAAVATAVLRTLAARGDWRELHLGGVGPDVAETCTGLGLGIRVMARSAAPFATLAADPLEALSRNSRQQIRRSLRLYEERGALTVSRASGIAEAWAWLDDMAAAHTATWQARGRPGAFAAPSFRRFHRALIAAGNTDLLRIRAGSEEVGILYNLRHRNVAYSYQSGLHYPADERLKPGLVSHILAMGHYAAEGLTTYRFLAGDSRYKSSLATGKDDLLWLAVHRHDLPHRLEAAARAVAGRLRKR